MAAVIDEAMLKQVIPAFYARVRADEMIGPLFNAAIDHWDEHLERLIAFWSSVMLTSGRYKGSPVVAHQKHRDIITPEMFDRWLSLWGDVTGAMLDTESATAMQAKAAMIAESLKLSLFFRLSPTAAAA